MKGAPQENEYPVSPVAVDTKYKYLAIDALFGAAPLQKEVVDEFLHDSDKMIRTSQQYLYLCQEI